MKLSIFHSVNAGLYIWDGTRGLLVDGIHDGREEGMSRIPEEFVRQIGQNTGIFGHLDGAVFTHLHHDHYDERGVGALLDQRPELPVYGPGLQTHGALIRPIRWGLRSVRIGGIYILAQDTLHDGEAFRNDPHQSFLIRMGGENIFVAGDAKLRPEEAGDFAGFYDAPVESAFCNLYQIASPEGQEFLRQLEPARVFLYHLPFQEDDRYHYHKLARQIVRNYPKDLPPVEQLRHMAWIDDRRAQWDDGKGEK